MPSIPDIPWNLFTGVIFLGAIATWGGILFVPLLVVGVRIARKGPAEARWLLLTPLSWLVALGLMTRIHIPHASSDEVGPAFQACCAAVLISVLFAPAFAWQRELKSWWVTAWMALNLLISLSTFPALFLLSFDT